MTDMKNQIARMLWNGVENLRQDGYGENQIRQIINFDNLIVAWKNADRTELIINLKKQPAELVGPPAKHEH